jgi:hypothetical protein
MPPAVADPAANMASAKIETINSFIGDSKLKMEQIALVSTSGRAGLN